MSFSANLMASWHSFWHYVAITLQGSVSGKPPIIFPTWSYFLSETSIATLVQFLERLAIGYHIGTLHLQIPHFKLQFLNFAPWAVFVLSSSFSVSSHGIAWASIRIAYAVNRLHLFEPLSLLAPVPGSMLSSPFLGCITCAASAQ
ncbi:hypothetical protein Tco_0725212 [Tanacetum coccineum]|uniref:Uncharacterized protein n=1 Tax=Tanacetum coccineum TaxID=301880 RepID=A0ABQ4YEE0_9ASTR